MAHRSVEFTDQELDELVLQELRNVISGKNSNITYNDVELGTLPAKLTKSLRMRQDTLHLEVDNIEVVRSLNRLHTSGRITLRFSHSCVRKTRWFSKDFVEVCMIQISLVQ